MAKLSDKMLTEIKTKEKLTEKLHKKLDQLTNLELEESSTRADLMTSDLSEKISGKITEKAKVAYCDKTLNQKITEIKWLKNDISKIKNQINLCDDKISTYKYAIREAEL